MSPVLHSCAVRLRYLNPICNARSVLETLTQSDAGTKWKPGALWVGLVAGVILALDQFTKFLVVQNIGMGNAWAPIPGFDFFRIVGTYNTGTACGYFPQLSIVFTFAPFLILAAVIWFYRSQAKPSWLLSLAIGLIIGGAVGNLIDRLRLGYVVDFVAVGTFPIFNVADAAVSTAVVLLLLWSLREESHKADAAPAGAAANKSSWKLGAVFIGVLLALAALTYFVCVLIPANFLR